MEFVILYEYNNKEHELFIFYLQWTGNEEALTKLNTIMSKVLYEDPYSYITLNIETKIPQAAVDIHCQASKTGDPNAYNKLFNKCTGKFFYPFCDEDLQLDEYEIGDLISDTFCRCKIERFFK